MTGRWAVIGEVQGVEYYSTKAEAQDRIKALRARHIGAYLYDTMTPLPLLPRDG